ncbi:MAG: pyridoxal 5'-phosphate synthase glutaminase subunit PdxT [Acidimicrobiia bacterium]
MRVGVLALQGAFARHIAAFAELGADVVEVRTPADLTGVQALAMPGGESTAMSRLLVTSGLFDELDMAIKGGLPVFGTCAGMILLAREVADGRPDQRSFAAIDVSVRRNGYGRQIDSFEADLDVAGLQGGPFHAVFIRAPVVTDAGAGVEVLARYDEVPVLVRQGRVTVASFHPELTADHRLHAQFLQEVG